MLVQSFIVESIPQNIRYLLNLLTCYVVEDVAYCSGLPAVVIRSIQEKFLGTTDKNQIPEVVFCALDTLANLTGLWEYMKRDGKVGMRCFSFCCCTSYQRLN